MSALSALPVPAPEDLALRYAALAQRERLLPVKITGFYRAKIDEEIAALGGSHGPLHRTALPVAERFDVHAGHEVADWVDDRSNMGAPGSAAIIHKYADRVLFMPTSVCAGHCQYCFRQDVLSEAHEAGRRRLSDELDRLEAYLAKKPAVSEVILSGGDPLVMPLRDLALVLERLGAIPQVRYIRIHSRVPAFAPRLLADPARLDLLDKARVRLVCHFVHPYEICGEVAAALEAAARRGLRLYNHFPMLRGVNDHADVVAHLIEKLDDLCVRTLSVYVPEPIRHSAPFRLQLNRFFAIQDRLTETSPSWINAVRFTLDSPIGKVRREQIVARSNGRITFRREGREFAYPDFPAVLDVPGDPAVMLWKGRA
ncbi:radical SAM protein [Methylobrevis pamukkalensis]|uniref:L-lysine 2,3-aminomutase n=1 Tax=Methylobrevis pamukkalensis TaxID=1439726 RepID=A0A1E3H364_9HYPH|nr:radical SAM protein [Methylobrevis pamukkalensis]ODN70773.1 L-lysine 2,3-aminomutase [Methylobrevis pamukkalensis]